MIASETYAEQWSNFFILVGTGSATLAGLVFVALTINLRGVAKDATHRFRAINMLSGFTSVFVISALALMGHQPYLALGIEWLSVSVLATAINTNGYIQAYRLQSSLYALSLFRIIGGTLCFLGQIVGSILLILGVVAGIYVGAISLVVNFFFFISGAWLLILGTLDTAD
ncbi:MAG TPA: hypothetical protein VHZ98_08025 [Galbitalea sp.]|nr:hypothetical protein [Galbitalea sp.]